MIKINISMPTNCMDCPCLDHENGECQITGNRDTYTMERPRSCPLEQESTPISELTQKAYEDGKKDGYVQAKVEKELKTGHWIPIYQGDEVINYRCSECEFGNTFGKKPYGMKFCHNCGVKMEGMT